jgi:hypothetical protein
MSGSIHKPSRLFRRLVAELALACLVATAAGASDVSFVRVWPGWRTQDFFMRISEYFGQPEDPGSRILLRTHPGDRTGCYFVARVRNKGVPENGATFVLRVITPDSPEPRVFTFATAVPVGEPVYEIGLTGADWPSRKVHPVAWRLELRSADGGTLAASQSYLWSK